MADHHLFLRVSGVLYLGLMTNLLLVLASLPLVVLLVTTDPARSWPALAVAAVLAAPGLSAAFQTFAHQAGSGDMAVVRPFLQAWRNGALRSLLIALATVASTVVLIVDIVWVGGKPVGAVATPVLAVLAVLVVAVGLGSLVATPQRPDATLRSIARAVVYLMARRWYLTLMSLACVLVLTALVVRSPALGFGVALAPLLYLIWTNTRLTLLPILPRSAITAAAHA